MRKKKRLEDELKARWRGARCVKKDNNFPQTQLREGAHLLGEFLDENEGSDEHVGSLHVGLELGEVALVAKLLQKVAHHLQRGETNHKSEP